MGQRYEINIEDRGYTTAIDEYEQMNPRTRRVYPSSQKVRQETAAESADRLLIELEDQAFTLVEGLRL